MIDIRNPEEIIPLPDKSAFHRNTHVGIVEKKNGNKEIYVAGGDGLLTRYYCTVQ